MKLSLGEGHGEGNVSMEHHDMGGHHDNMSLNMGHGSDSHGDSSHGIGHAVVEMAGHAMKSMLGGHAPSGKHFIQLFLTNKSAFGHNTLYWNLREQKHN